MISSAQDVRLRDLYEVVGGWSKLCIKLLDRSREGREIEVGCVEKSKVVCVCVRVWG